MKYLVDVCLIVAMLVVIWLAQGWWQLLSIMPFIALLMSIQPGGIIDKSIGPRAGGTASDKMEYTITQRNGDTVEVNCLCPVQFDGKWAHFTDEITEYGYHPHVSVYKPVSVKLVIGADETQTLN